MNVFLQRILQEIMKKIIFGTSDAWSTIHLYHRPSNPATQLNILEIDGFYELGPQSTEGGPHIFLWDARYLHEIRGKSGHRI